MRHWFMAAIAAGILVGPHIHPAFGAQLSTDARGGGHVRYLDERLGEIANIAFAQSAAFRALIDVLESSDVVVYVEEGRCNRGAVRSCLRMMASTAGVRYVRVTLNPRGPVTAAVGQLAHELHHATEVAGRTEVVDSRTLRALYEKIGFDGCDCIAGECWETQAAIDSGRLVQQQATATIATIHATR